MKLDSIQSTPNVSDRQVSDSRTRHLHSQTRRLALSVYHSKLLLYPQLIGRIGIRTSYYIFLLLSVVAYCFLPVSVLLLKNETLIWIWSSALLDMHVLSRTFVNPATVLLVNNAAPRPKLLGTIHGLAQSTSSAARIIGPMVGGVMLGWGLSHNFVALPLWLLTIVVIPNWIVLLSIEDVDISR